MNDLNIAALQAARQANASGSRAAQTRGTEDPAADFDRVMARVACRDAAATRGREAPARDDAQPSRDEGTSTPAPAATDSSGASDVGVDATADAATSLLPQFAPAVPVSTGAVPADTAARTDPPSSVEAAPASPPPAPANDRMQSAPAAANAPAANPDVPPEDAAKPPRAAPRAAPVAAHAAQADAAEHSAVAASAGSAPRLSKDVAAERAGEPADRRFEPMPASAQSTLRAETAGAQNNVAPAVAPHAPQTYSIAHAKIATPVLHPGFGEDLASRVVFLAGQRVQSAEIALTPADLGPLSVAIELRGQEAQLFFSAAHATTRAAIEDALPRLREMFAGSGLQLADAQVGDHTRRDFARSQRGSRDQMRAIGSVNVTPDLLRPARPAHPDRLIDVVV